MVGTAELAFRWHGGRLSVNFTATLGKRGGQAFERLRDPGDLARWFREAGMAAGPPKVSARDLVQARELREALYGLFTAPDADLDVVNRWATRPAPGGRLERQAGQLTLHPPETDVRDMFSALARDGAALVTGPLASRIRECGRDDCWLLFVDESRAANRRWCSMETCGARTKMARYRTPDQNRP
ncbi:CGNR zinc finger domain-containing protein [Saccharothrix deserti]|uniref:CGNR zinc finger domain-containing protein n=1 Tax=Saccharothrix deserti TaxID=2593674 RepID=UPI00131C4FE6|nr:ABATE domain-containing protein [Saccharothrix deserti]